MSSSKLQDLFGSDSDDDQASPGAQPQQAQQSGQQAQANEDSPPPAPVSTQAFKLPKTDSEFPFDSSVKIMKKIPLVGLEPAPFDRQQYLDQEESASPSTHDKNLVAIRWRFAKDENGRDVRETNTRLVRWSDGTQQVVVGNDVFDVSLHNTPLHQTFLYVAHKAALRPQTKISQKLFLRTTESSKIRIQSETQVDETAANNKMKIVATERDPEEETRKRLEDDKRKRRKERQSLPKHNEFTKDFIDNEDEDDYNGRDYSNRYDDVDRDRRLMDARRSVPTTSRRRRSEIDDEVGSLGSGDESSAKSTDDDDDDHRREKSSRSRDSSKRSSRRESGKRRREASSEEEDGFRQEPEEVQHTSPKRKLRVIDSDSE